jgi:hypothetical protein
MKKLLVCLLMVSVVNVVAEGKYSKLSQYSVTGRECESILGGWNVLGEKYRVCHELNKKFYEQEHIEQQMTELMKKCTKASVKGDTKKVKMLQYRQKKLEEYWHENVPKDSYEKEIKIISPHLNADEIKKENDILLASLALKCVGTVGKGLAGGLWESAKVLGDDIMKDIFDKCR